MKILKALEAFLLLGALALMYKALSLALNGDLGLAIVTAFVSCIPYFGCLACFQAGDRHPPKNWPWHNC
jgi:hypothetical protein